MKQLILLFLLSIGLTMQQPLLSQGTKLKEVKVPEHMQEKLRNSMLEASIGTEYLVILPPNDPTAECDNLGIYVGALDGAEVELWLDYELKAKASIKKNGMAAFVWEGARESSDSYSPEIKLLKREWEVRGKKQEKEPLGFYIKSDNPIMVYVGSFYLMSADGYMALPISALGTKYIHCSYRDKYEPQGPRDDMFHTGFACAAAYDGTVITVDLKEKTSSFPGLCMTDAGDLPNISFKSPSLKAREAWNVWNSFKGYTRSQLNTGACDFSGSIIRATKPIAVFSYHERTTIPQNNASRDNLVEQLLPVSKWGKEYYSLQFDADNVIWAPDIDPNRGGGDYFRIVAAEDSTKVDVVWQDFTENGGSQRKSMPVLLTNAGDYWGYKDETPRALGESSITGACRFTANKPIQVMQYCYTRDYFGDVGNKFDPLMVILPPMEQYGHETVFQTAITRGFSDHHYNLIALGDPRDPERNATLLGSIRLTEMGDANSQTIEEIDPYFMANRINGTDYYYARLNLRGARVYTIKGQTKIGGIIYGFGSAVSYGWPSSMALVETHDQDTLKPQVTHSNASCANPNGTPDRPTRKGILAFQSTYADTTNYPASNDFNDAQVDQGLTEAPRLLPASENMTITEFQYYRPAAERTDKWSAPVAVHAGGVKFTIDDMYKNAWGFVYYKDQSNNITLDTMLYIADKISWKENGAVVNLLNFGLQRAGTNKVMTISIRNTTDEDENNLIKDIRLDSLFLSGISPAFSITNTYGKTFPFDLRPGDEAKFDITYVPDGKGKVTDKLTLYTECLFFTIDIMGTSGIPKIRVTDVNFGQVVINQKTAGSQRKAINVTNDGNENLIVTGFYFSPLQDADNGPFFFEPEIPSAVPTPTRPDVIKPQETKTYRFFSFKPSQKEEVTANFCFVSDAASIELDPDRKECATLKGSGIQSGPAITSCDWGERRVKTSNDSIIELSNTGNMDITVREITGDGWKAVGNNLVSADGSYFILNYKDYYKTISPDSEPIKIQVNFTPQSEYPPYGSCSVTEKIYINFTAASSVTDRTIYSLLSGEGILPKTAATGYTFKSVNVSEVSTETGTVIVRNTSQTAKLYIESIDFVPGGHISDFNLINPTNINAYNNTYVPTGDSVIYEIKFTPTSTMPPTRKAEVKIRTDAKSGPEVNPRTDTTVVLLGSTEDSGLQITQLDFGTVTRCTDTVATFTIFNLSTTTPLTVQSISIDPDYEQIFIIDTAKYKNTIIQPGQKLDVEVRYIADAAQATSATITAQVNVKTNVLDTSTTISAKSMIIPVHLSVDNYLEKTPGTLLDYPIHIKISDANSFFTYANANITQFKIVFKFDPSTIRVQNVIGQNLLLSTDSYLGTATVTTTGNGVSVNSDGNLFELKVLLLQGDKTDFDILFESISFLDRDVCVAHTSAGGNITLNVCGDELREITISQNKFSIDPVAPNPYNAKSLKIGYTLGFDVDTKIDIYNSNGELVKEVMNNFMPAGRHEALLNLTDFNAGSYIINMKSGPFENQQTLVIVK